MKGIIGLILITLATNAMSQEIFNAIIGDDIEKVKSIIEADSSMLEITQEHNMTPLMFAGSKGKYEIAKYLIEKGANVNYLRPMGFCSLKFAAMSGHFDIVKLFIENGADVNNKDNFGRTPIYDAVIYGTKEIAQYLIEQGAVIPTDNTLLHPALAKGINELVNYLLENGANIYSLNESGGNLLHSAARGNGVEIINRLLVKGVDINSRNRYGFAPIHIASINGNKKFIQTLIEQGADVNLFTNTGKNAFVLAYENGHHGLAEILLNAGLEEIFPDYMDLPGEKYLGLDKPGLLAEIFAPGIISTEKSEHGAIAFTPGMNEIYWQANGIKYIKKVKGNWTFPDTIGIFQKYQANNPAISADGKTLFFQSRISSDQDGTLKDNDLWFVRKTSKGWSEPENLGPNVNSELSETMPSLARNGNIYFMVNKDIYRSVFKNGKYQPREKLKPPMNDGLGNASPYIAPDESFIIFESIRPGGFSFVNLYICFKDKNGSWTQPVIMGEDICKGNARFPGTLSPDGEYFFFTIDLDYYWVDAKIIEDIKLSREY